MTVTIAVAGRSVATALISASMCARYFSSARRPAAVRRYSVRGSARRTIFSHDDVLRVLELARVHAQVAVGRLQQPLEIVERQPIVHRQRADDAEPQTLVDQPIEVAADWPLRRLRLPACRSRLRASSTSDLCRLHALLYPPYFLAITNPNPMCRPPKPAAMSQCPHAAGAANGATPSAMKHEAHERHDADRKRAAGGDARCRRAAASSPAAAPSSPQRREHRRQHRAGDERRQIAEREALRRRRRGQRRADPPRLPRHRDDGDRDGDAPPRRARQSASAAIRPADRRRPRRRSRSRPSRRRPIPAPP